VLMLLRILVRVLVVRAQRELKQAVAQVS